MTGGTLVSGPVVDTAAAGEFMREILARTSEDDLAGIAGDCERKADAFAGLLGGGRAASLGGGDLRRVLRAMFGSRRKADAIVDTLGASLLAAEIDHLLEADGDLAGRVERFDRALGAFTDSSFDLPGELLHFTYPRRYWPWTRWMWDPRVGTGALRLVTTEEFDLSGQTRGETYMKVGEAVAFVAENVRAVGFSVAGSSPFGIDVFLACVYAVYLYTVLRMRMTQEFTKIVPELPDLVRRLLGVHRLEV